MFIYKTSTSALSCFLQHLSHPQTDTNKSFTATKTNSWTEINTCIHLPSEIVGGFCYKIPTRLFHRKLWKYSTSPCFWTVIIHLLMQKFSHIWKCLINSTFVMQNIICWFAWALNHSIANFLLIQYYPLIRHSKKWDWKMINLNVNIQKVVKVEDKARQENLLQVNSSSTISLSGVSLVVGCACPETKMRHWVHMFIWWLQRSTASNSLWKTMMIPI